VEVFQVGEMHRRGAGGTEKSDAKGEGEKRGKSYAGTSLAVSETTWTRLDPLRLELGPLAGQAPVVKRYRLRSLMTLDCAVNKGG